MKNWQVWAVVAIVAGGLCKIKDGCGVFNPSVDVNISADKFTIEGFSLNDDLDTAYAYFKDKYNGKGKCRVENYRDDEFQLLKEEDGKEKSIVCISAANGTSRRINYISISKDCLPGYDEERIKEVLVDDGLQKKYHELSCLQYYFKLRYGIPIDDSEYRKKRSYYGGIGEDPPVEYNGSTYRLRLGAESVWLEPR